MKFHKILLKSSGELAELWHKLRDLQGCLRECRRNPGILCDMLLWRQLCDISCRLHLFLNFWPTSIWAYCDVSCATGYTSISSSTTNSLRELSTCDMGLIKTSAMWRQLCDMGLIVTSAVWFQLCDVSCAIWGLLWVSCATWGLLWRQLYDVSCATSAVKTSSWIPSGGLHCRSLQARLNG